MNAGCNARLAPDQWWNFCGETDMGQTLPALCTCCGGEFIRADDPEATSKVAALKIKWAAENVVHQAARELEDWQRPNRWEITPIPTVAKTEEKPTEPVTPVKVETSDVQISDVFAPHTYTSQNRNEIKHNIGFEPAFIIMKPFKTDTDYIEEILRKSINPQELQLTPEQKEKLAIMLRTASETIEKYSKGTPESKFELLLNINS